jgi:tRNA(Ile)-lysidine synthase
MLDGATGVVVALSGGPDSIVLLDMLLRLKAGLLRNGLDVKGERTGRGGKEMAGPEAPQFLSTSGPTRLSKPQTEGPIFHLHIAHLDHLLRGRESAGDAEFVRALAERLEINITVSSVDVRAAALSSGRGIEEMAREIRYDFLLAVAARAGCDRIAVGHTMTDQAETFLMRLIRGAGMRGLAAMRPVVPALTLCPSVPLLIRPLLCITREEVEAYCRKRGLEFRTDSTNQSLHYTRNRIRSTLLPLLGTINPRVVESISRAAENISADQDVLDDLALALLGNARLTSGPWWSCGDRSIAVYQIKALMDQPVGLRRRMIIEAIRLMRGGEICKGPEADNEVSSVHVASVEALLTREISGKHIALPGSLEAWREFDALVLKRSGGKESAYHLSINPACSDVEAGGFVVTIQRAVPVELLEAIVEEARAEKELTGRDWMRVAMDDRALPEDLIVRPRQRGERVAVIGRPRTIKLKNLMIDHRIPSSRRATWPLVTTPEGAYIWSPGLPPALEFLAHKETESLAIVRAIAI